MTLAPTVLTKLLTVLKSTGAMLFDQALLLDGCGVPMGLRKHIQAARTLWYMLGKGQTKLEKDSSYS